MSTEANPPRGNAADSTTATKPRHPAILRVSSLAVATILSALLITGVAPPIVADQSDRAVVNAPVVLLTAPIEGDIDDLGAAPGHEVRSGETLARIVNPRVDRGTLISLQDKAADARQKLEAARARRDADRAYVASLDRQIASLEAELKTQFASQIDELSARVAQSEAIISEKKALVDRQTSMVQRNTASMDMLRPTSHLYEAAQRNAEAEKARLEQKTAQFAALDNGVYAGDDLVTLNTMAQKRRDMDLDAQNMDIEEKQLSAVLVEREALIATESQRLDRLAMENVQAPGVGTLLTLSATPGRHVSAGDTIASLINCDRRFVVAIFSYRQGQSMHVGTHVKIEGAGARGGVVSAVLPKTSDKVDERFAVPFPQTERRELYAIITPDKETTTRASTASTADASDACAVGQWVTVTRDNAIVPSMSVTWRRLENLAAFFSGAGAAAAAAAKPPRAFKDPRQSARVRLATEMRATPAPDADADLAHSTDWLLSKEMIVSR